MTAMTGIGWLLLASGLAAAQGAPPPATLPVGEPPAPAPAPAPAGGTVEPGADEPVGGEPSADEPVGGEEVVVVGTRLRGATTSNLPPEQTLSPADIRSYGASSVGELIEALGPQTNAAAGPPIVLLNGRRISSFNEIREIPPEAIARTEILPEDVSLSYGYAANQKVVNIVLRQRFRAWTGEAVGGTTTEGGRGNAQASANLLRLQRDTRLNLDARYSRAGDLLESQRDIVASSPATPFALGGNVAGLRSGLEIDPALSALAGRTVTVAALPAGIAGRPALTAFAGGVAAVDDTTRFRTLLPATDALAFNATLARPLSEAVQATINTRLEFTGSDGLQGLPGLTLTVPAGSPFTPFGQDVRVLRSSDALGALGQQVRGETLHVGTTLNGTSGEWQWTFTGNYDRALTRTRTERGIDGTALQAAITAGDSAVNPFATLPGALTGTLLSDRARTLASTLNGDLLLSGPLFRLPAGQVRTNVTITGGSSDVASRSSRGGVLRASDFARDTLGVRSNVDVPIASRRNGALTALGDLALNGNLEVRRLSDYGRLTSWGYGVRWSPVAAVRLIGSANYDRTAPTGQQLNDPFVLTPNVPVFDYAVGQSVFVAQLGGGNPDLRESRQRRLRLQGTLRPWSARDLTVSAILTDLKTDDPIAGFPVPTPRIEAALPDRFVRDASGRLVQIDARPINFAGQRRTDLRYGFNWSIAVKSTLQKEIERWRAAGAKPEDRPAALTAAIDAREAFRAQRERERERGGTRPAGTPAAAAAPGTAPPPFPPPSGGERRGFGPGGGGFGGGRGGGVGGPGGGGRVQFALFHTWRLRDTITIADGVPVLDLLNGAAIGATGGEARHSVEAQAGYVNNGVGGRLSAEWRSATRVDQSLTGTDQLRFGSLGTIDLRLFADPGQRPEWIRAHPFLRGSRLTVSVENLLDTKQTVRGPDGSVPLRFQQDYLDPLGRRVVVGVRKLFF